MPLSKARDAERKRLQRRVVVQPKNEDVQPKLPFYAGASDHFGEVRNKRYARQFFVKIGGE